MTVTGDGTTIVRRVARMSTSLPDGPALSPVVFLVTAALDAGGWAVITVVRTPDTVVAGEPVTVTYAARQHGQTLLNGLQGRIEARLGETVIHATRRLCLRTATMLRR